MFSCGRLPTLKLRSSGQQLTEQVYYLKSEEPVLELDLLGEEIGADRSLVLIAELLVHISELYRS